MTAFSTVRAAVVDTIAGLTPTTVANGAQRFVVVDHSYIDDESIDRLFDVVLREPPSWAAPVTTTNPRWSLSFVVVVYYAATRDAGEDLDRISEDAAAIQIAMATADLGAPITQHPVAADLVRDPDGNYKLSIEFSVLMQ